MTTITGDSALWLPFFAAIGVRLGWWAGGRMIAAIEWLLSMGRTE